MENVTVGCVFDISLGLIFVCSNAWILIRSGLSEASSNKTTPATPRVSKIGRAGSAKTDSDLPSPMQIPRLSIDRSPRSIESKPAVERRATKMSSTPPDVRELKILPKMFMLMLNLVFLKYET